LSAAADLPYLDERLKDPTYDRAFTALFKNEKDLAPWLRRYLKNRDGVEGPGRAVDATGKPYELYDVCEPHNCAGNFIYILVLVGRRQSLGSVHQGWRQPSVLRGAGYAATGSADGGSAGIAHSPER
jgi:hypothetical protein